MLRAYARQSWNYLRPCAIQPENGFAPESCLQNCPRAFLKKPVSYTSIQKHKCTLRAQYEIRSGIVTIDL